MAVKTLTQAEIRNRITLNNFYNIIKDDFVSIPELEDMCRTMFRTGVSPLYVLRKYFSKYDLEIEVVHALINGSTQRVNPKKVRFNRKKPTLIVVNYDSSGVTMKVELMYHAGYEVKNKSKFFMLKFWKN